MRTLLQKTKAYEILKSECEEQNSSHAYLVLFEDFKNLRFVLKEFSKILFGCAFSNTPDSMRISRLIDEENFTDCLFYPLSGKKISADDAEAIKEESLLSPVEGEKKVFIISDFAEADPRVQNKLLKVLEEPPKGVIFLIGATTVFPILSTVLSRTKKLEILPFDIRETTACLKRIYKDRYDDKTLSLCAATSGGNVGEAQSILEGGYYNTLTEQAFALALSSSDKLPKNVRDVGESKHRKQLISLLRLLYRDALLLKTNPKEKKQLFLQGDSRIQEIANQYTLHALLYAQEAFTQAEKQITFNTVFPQCIELCISNIRMKNLIK